MRDARKGILALMAAGRITAGEAERLIALWNEGREAMWIAVVCLAVFAAQGMGQAGLGHVVHAAIGAGWHGLEGAVNGMMNHFGGRL